MNSKGADDSQIVTPGRQAYIATREATALLVVDVQERLFPHISENQAILANMRRCIEGAKIFGIPIIATEQYPKGLGATIPQVREILPPGPIIPKVSFTCFGNEEFITALAKTKARYLVVIGIETHICISQTCLDAVARGYTVHAVSDAMSSRTRANWTVGLEKMRQGGVIISSAETVLYEIAERADTDEFKRMLDLVK